MVGWEHTSHTDLDLDFDFALAAPALWTPDSEHSKTVGGVAKIVST